MKCKCESRSFEKAGVHKSSTTGRTEQIYRCKDCEVFYYYTGKKTARTQVFF